MNRLLPFLLVVLALVGCASPAAPTPPAPVDDEPRVGSAIVCPVPVTCLSKGDAGGQVPTMVDGSVLWRAQAGGASLCPDGGLYYANPDGGVGTCYIQVPPAAIATQDAGDGAVICRSGAHAGWCAPSSGGIDAATSTGLTGNGTAVYPIELSIPVSEGHGGTGSLLSGCASGNLWIDQGGTVGCFAASGGATVTSSGVVTITGGSSATSAWSMSKGGAGQALTCSSTANMLLAQSSTLAQCETMSGDGTLTDVGHLAVVSATGNGTTFPIASDLGLTGNRIRFDSANDVNYFMEQYLSGLLFGADGNFIAFMNGATMTVDIDGNLGIAGGITDPSFGGATNAIAMVDGTVAASPGNTVIQSVSGQFDVTPTSAPYPTFGVNGHGLTGNPNQPLSECLSTVSVGVGGTTTLGATPVQCPALLLTATGTTTSDIVLDFGTAAIGASGSLWCFDVAFPGITFGTVYSIDFKNGTSTIAYGGNGVNPYTGPLGRMVRVCTAGANKIAASF